MSNLKVIIHHHFSGSNFIKIINQDIKDIDHLFS